MQRLSHWSVLERGLASLLLREKSELRGILGNAGIHAGSLKGFASEFYNILYRRSATNLFRNSLDQGSADGNNPQGTI